MGGICNLAVDFKRIRRGSKPPFGSLIRVLVLQTIKANPIFSHFIRFALIICIQDILVKEAPCLPPPPPSLAPNHSGPLSTMTSAPKVNIIVSSEIDTHIPASDGSDDTVNILTVNVWLGGEYLSWCLLGGFWAVL